jgi:phosphate transport system substrate-binding protein
MSKALVRPACMALLCLLVAISPSHARAERITLAGTGAATAFLRSLATEFTAQTAIEAEVISGMGSNGALKAMADGAIDVVAAGRPLSEAETAKGMTVAFSLRTPFVLTTSHPNPGSLSLPEINQAYASPNATWSNGEPIRVILRPKHESDTVLMEQMFSGLAEAMDSARRRPDIPVAATDQDNARLAEQTPGSLIGITYLQVVTEKRNLRLVTVDGAQPTMQNYASGVYPYGKNIDLVLPQASKPAAQRFIAYARSAGSELLYRQAHGY